MFDGFLERRIPTGDADIFVLTGGSGRPLLLLHGFPQNHVMWHRVAPLLASRFFLVIPDLRGYGDSTGPAPDPAHRHYAKRTMGADMMAVMAALGHSRFFAAGHDRGARVAYRLALDHPDCVERLAVLDIVPTFEVWARMDRGRALNGYHWLFLAQPAPLPERLIAADPRFYLHHLLNRWAGRRDPFDPAAVEHYERHFCKPSVIEAACEDYRAGAGVDLEDDRADRDAGRRIECPALLLWGTRYLSAKAEAPLDVWRRWATDLRDVPIDCGHFLPEEEPAASAAALSEFFAG